MNSSKVRALVAKWRDEIPPECTCGPVGDTMDSHFHSGSCPRMAWNRKNFQADTTTQRKCADELEASLASEPLSRPVDEAQIFDLQLFYDQLVDGQIIKESDGDPWPLTKSEAKQIVEALAERLKVVWPLRAAQSLATLEPGATGYVEGMGARTAELDSWAL